MYLVIKNTTSNSLNLSRIASNFNHNFKIISLTNLNYQFVKKNINESQNPFVNFQAFTNSNNEVTNFFFT